MRKIKRLLVAVLACVMLLPVSAAQAAETQTAVAPPADVSENAWYSQAVNYVWEHKYMQGAGDGTFSPDTTITRVQMFQTLYQMQGSPAVANKTSFEDVAADAWYANAAAWAKTTKLTSGTANGFSADLVLSRQDLSKIICAYSDLVGQTLQGGDISGYSDAGLVASYALPYMKEAVGSGILKGSDGQLNPESTVTRAQLAQILYNFSQRNSTYYSAKRPLLVEGAMDIETTTMISALSNPVDYTLGEWKYVAGTYCGYPMVVCRTEQGEANCAASTALAMQFFNPIAVINQGTSGGHDPSLHTFDIVLGKQTFDGSAWKSTASAKGAGVDYTAISMQGVYAYDKAAGEFTQSVYYDADPTLLNAANTVKSTYTQGNVVEGKIDTCDCWNNQIDRMLFLYEKFGSSCEEMETNAAAQIAKTYDVPFLGIRILSNTGIYGESFNWKTGAACQNYVLNVAKQYINGYLASASDSITANNNSKIAASSYDKTQRPILLEGAMGIETSTMIASIQNPVNYTIGRWNYVAGTYNGYPTVVCRTEQGLANCGASTALAMEYFNPCAVINQGTSGGHDPALHTFDIVLGEKTLNTCAWKTAASAKGTGADYKAFDMNGVYAYNMDKASFTQQVYHNGDAGLLAAATAAKSTYISGSVVSGTIGSSNEWNNQIDRMLYLHDKLGTSCEEMETDAAAQICQTYSVPFLGIRILSNTGIYGESFNVKSGPACQNYVLSVVSQYTKADMQLPNAA